MGDTNDAVFDEIWTFIEEKLKHPVPTYFKYVLNYCGYNNGISIATIEPDDIPHIVSEVRNGNVKNYFKKLNGDIDVLEGSTKTAENFEFSRGHFKYLMSIVDFLKKYAENNGPDSFTNAKQKKKIIKSMPSIPMRRFRYSVDNQTEMDNDIDKQKNILHKKMINSLKAHTPRLYAENNSKIKQKMDSDQLIILKVNLLKNMTTESETSEDINTESEAAEISEDNKKTRKYEASMFCPYCLKTTNVFYVSGCNWNSSNFDRHLKLTHSESVNSDRVNAKAAGPETDASEDAEPDPTDAIIALQLETSNFNKNAKSNATDLADQIVHTNVIEFMSETANLTYVINIHSDTYDETNDENSTAAVTSCAKDVKLSTTDSDDQSPPAPEYVDHSNVGKLSEKANCFSKSEKFDHEVLCNKNPELCKTSNSNTNEIYRKNNTSFKTYESCILPKPGDFVIFSQFLEIKEKWPENAPALKKLVGQVNCIKVQSDVVQNNGSENISKNEGEIDIRILKKSRYSNKIFTNLETNIDITIPTNSILKILQPPAKNRRGEYVFNGEVL